MWRFENRVILRKLFSAQKGVALRVLSAFRTVSTTAVLVLASVPPIDLLAQERQETFQLRKKFTCISDLHEIARTKEAIRKDERHRLVERWQTRWHGEQTGRRTYRLIPELATWLNRKNGEVDLYLAQVQGCHKFQYPKFPDFSLIFKLISLTKIYCKRTHLGGIMFLL